MRRALATVIALASITAVPAVTLAGPASAAAARPAAVATRPGFTGAERLRIISVAASARRQSVVAAGAFTAGGYQVAGQVAGLRAVDRMVFRNGRFRVTRYITSQLLPLPTSSCRISETIRGRLSIGGGTGSYRGMTGSGSFVLRISGVIRRSRGKCGGPMTAYHSVSYESAAVRG